MPQKNSNEDKAAKFGEKEFRLAVVARLLAEGRPSLEIRSILSDKYSLEVTQKVLAKDIMRLKESWRSSASGNIDSHVARELAELDRIGAEAWRQYYLSVERERGHEIVKINEDGESETTTKREAAKGDPKFLDIAAKASAERRRLLGLDEADAMAMLEGEGQEEWVKQRYASRLNKSANKG